MAPRPDTESARLDALRRYRILDTAEESSFDDFATIASIVCDTPIALMSLVDSDRQWFKARVGLEAKETPRELAFCAHTILGTEPFTVEDASTDERFLDNPLVTGDPGIRFYCGAPLIDGGGNALGSICVIDRQPRKLTSRQTEALRALARRIISELEVRRVSHDLATSLEQVRTLTGLLPICSHCKNIRADDGYWQNVDKYLRNHTDLELSHGICPKCLEIHYPDAYRVMVAKGIAM